MITQAGSRRRVLLSIAVPSLAVLLLCVLAASGAPAVADAPPNESDRLAGAYTTHMTEAEVEASVANLAVLEEMRVAGRPSARSGYVLADLTAEQLRILKQRGVEYSPTRQFVLTQGNGGSLNYEFATANNPNNVNIPDAGAWVFSDVTIAGIPPGNFVAGVDIHLIIRHTFVGDLYVQMRDPQVTFYQTLWNREGGGADDIDLWRGNLSGWNGRQGNGIWRLWVQDRAFADTGYIDFWEVRVYYGAVATPTPTPTCAASLPSPYVAYVNAGGPTWTDPVGRTWLADDIYAYCTPPYWGATGGQTYTTTHEIENTTYDTLYQSQRYFSENSGYVFDVPNGRFDVLMAFSEIYPSTDPGERVFDIQAERQTVASGLDVVQLAGGLYRWYDLEFLIDVTDNRLNIDFIRWAGKAQPFVSAIWIREVTGGAPTATPTPTATRTSTPPTPTPTPTATQVITGGTLQGTMRLQGRPAPPSNLLAVPLVVTFFTQGGSIPVRVADATANANGQFEVHGIIDGTYDVMVKHSQTLSAKQRNVGFNNNTVAVAFGSLLAGDANNDDAVNITDFSILRTSILRQCGDAGFDGRADFDGDCIVDATDFSLLRTNYMRTGLVGSDE